MRLIVTGVVLVGMGEVIARKHQADELCRQAERQESFRFPHPGAELPIPSS